MAVEGVSTVRSPYRWLVALCLTIALLAAVASTAGVFLRGDGSTADAESVRGEEFEYATTGIYRFNAERIVAEGVGWDLVTLALAVPALVVGTLWFARGSLRGRLFAVGVLAYLFYQYLMYSVYWAFGPLFPLFVLVYPLCAAAIVWIVTTIDVDTLRSRFSDRFPRRGVALFSFAVALILVIMWSQRIVAGLRGDLEAAMLLGTPTMTVQALDLGMIVPIALLTGVALWRDHAWGYLLAPVILVKAVTMAAAICAMLLSAWYVEGTLEAGPLAVFAMLTAAAALLAWRAFSSVHEEGASAR